MRRVGPYNAMDFARGLAAWAFSSGLLRPGPVTQRLWNFMLIRQHQDSTGRYGARSFGLTSAAQVNLFLSQLNSAARPLDSQDGGVERVSWVGL